MRGSSPCWGWFCSRRRRTRCTRTGRRRDKFSAARTRVAAIVLLGAIIAVFLFLGFFVSTRRTVAAISERLASLRDHDSRDLSAALDALAGGDLTVEITPRTRRSSRSRVTSWAGSPSPPTRSSTAPPPPWTATTACAARSRR
jgi:hypothetical protein